MKKNKMKAVIWTKYGPPEVLQLQEIEKPTPKKNEVLIKVFTTTVTTGDCEQRKLKLPFWFRFPMRAYIGFRKPKRIIILGMELAGEIEAIGEDVSLFKRGDQVFASTGFINMGTNAEYICLPEESKNGVIELKPNNISFEEATSIPVGGIEALCFIRQVRIQKGEKILINGAGGTIGTFAVQIAKYYGAEVIAVDSAGKLDMLQYIGADSVIDYTQEDFTKRFEKYDIILDIVNKSSFSDSIRMLNQNGRYLIANPRLSQMIRGRWKSITSDKKVIFGVTYTKIEDLIYLRELVEKGLLKSVIDRTYSLDQIIEAHKYVEKGHKKGNVVIKVVEN